MIRPAVTLLAALTALAACEPVPSANGLTGNVPLESYYLVGIGQDAVPERNMAVRFTGNQILGSGPCNSFTATNAAALPAIQVTNFVPTSAPCGEARQEQRFFEAVRSATSADYQGGVLLVKGPTYMQFEPGRPL
ncbi:META domain-containing protein [Paracoccus zhejiangensis]|uniref:META domain-containing protein n=1 Tax=Paracoccus zhejiangensis TaxID=1077935 RepID=A0A2H5F238_9RHOB|nr:META domain-containing protein [Paracoccus zhejiangensis]AUH65596.1 META domain-containing protein [Paracoccus zhejiangensis]